MVGTIVIIVIVLFAIVHHQMGTTAQKTKLDKRAIEGAKRTGRVGLWLALPPVGFWRSYKHGRRKANEELAKRIAEEMKKDA